MKRLLLVVICILSLITILLFCQENNHSKNYFTYLNEYDSLYINQYIFKHKIMDTTKANINDREEYRELLEYIKKNKYDTIPNKIRLLRIEWYIVYSCDSEKCLVFNYDVVFIFKLNSDKLKYLYLKDKKIVDTNFTFRQGSDEYYIFEPFFTRESYENLSRNYFIKFWDNNDNHYVVNASIEGKKYDVILEGFNENQDKSLWKKTCEYEDITGSDIFFFLGLNNVAGYFLGYKVFTDFATTKDGILFKK